MNCQYHKPSFNLLQFRSCATRFPLLTFMSFSHALRRYPSPLSLNSSFTQVHNYGTIDYESREAWNWRSLYRRIATMGNPNFGSSSVLDWWRKEGRKVSSWELRRIIKELRKFRRFKLALEVCSYLPCFYFCCSILCLWILLSSACIWWAVVLPDHSSFLHLSAYTVTRRGCLF